MENFNVGLSLRFPLTDELYFSCSVFGFARIEGLVYVYGEAG